MVEKQFPSICWLCRHAAHLREGVFVICPNVYGYDIGILMELIKINLTKTSSESLASDKPRPHYERLANDENDDEMLLFLTHFRSN